MTRTIKALSLRRPWPWAIFDLPPEYAKDVENRMWHTDFRGSVLIHAAKGCTVDEYYDGVDFIVATCLELGRRTLVEVPPLEQMAAGGIVGAVDIVDCVDSITSPWFVGKWGFVLRNPRKLPFVECRGQQGFFPVPNDVVARIKELKAA